LQLDAQNQQMRAEQFQQRLASQESQTDKRIESAMQRELLKQRGQDNGRG
jgi:predicted HTH transcriptional regulator